MSITSTINRKRLASVLVPDVLTAVISIYVLGLRAPPSPDSRALPGKALAAYDDSYPIRTDDTGALHLDRELFVEAVNCLSQHPSPRAVTDLIYLGNSNNVTLLLDGPIKAKYLMPIQQPDCVILLKVDRERDHVFQSYVDIVNGAGQVFAGTPIEIVLHDTRNPPRSVVTVQNPISDRRLSGTSTNFGIQFIKDCSYGGGQGQGRGASPVSYDLILKGGRAMKSAMIPTFHDVCGLVGFICTSIDISKMDKKHPEYIEHFVDIFKATIASDATNGMIQNNKRKN